MKKTNKKIKKVRKLVIGEVEKRIGKGGKFDPVTCQNVYCQH